MNEFMNEYNKISMLYIFYHYFYLVNAVSSHSILLLFLYICNVEFTNPLNYFSFTIVVFIKYCETKQTILRLSDYKNNNNFLDHQ